MTREQATDLVRGLVAIPSLSRQEQDASAWLVAQMAAAGYDRAYVDAAGNAVGEIGPLDATRVVVLLGHIDTVPGDIPVRIDGGRLFGRGSVDAKGPLATFAVAGARLGSRWAHEAPLRLIVVGAVEEEAATSKGARFIAARFDGATEPVPAACIIGEPSSWRRVTLGYKGRLLLDLSARQAMAHTAGPDASVAEVVVDLWNWVRAHADSVNTGVDKPFDQLSPSLRRFVTANEGGLTDTVDAQVAWRLPHGFDPDAFARTMLAWAATHVGTGGEVATPLLAHGAGERGRVTISGPRTSLCFTFRGWERPWRSDRHNALVRAFLAAARDVDPAVQPGFVVKTGTSDMNVVGPAWRCPIVAYGPGDSALDHTPHEHLELDEYWKAIQVLESTIRRLAQAFPSTPMPGA
jgi:[amino group carrier protein]-lysine/ornithine hydrolase